MDNNILTALIRENKRVVIPDFGAFLKKEGPEGEELIFSPFLRRDDGSLAAMVAEKYGVDDDDARAMISEYALHIRQTLASPSAHFRIEEVGTLVVDANGVISLRSDEVEVVETVDEIPAPAANVTETTRPQSIQVQGAPTPEEDPDEETVIPAPAAQEPAARPRPSIQQPYVGGQQPAAASFGSGQATENTPHPTQGAQPRQPQLFGGANPPAPGASQPFGTSGNSTARQQQPFGGQQPAAQPFGGAQSGTAAQQQPFGQPRQPFGGAPQPQQPNNPFARPTAQGQPFGASAGTGQPFGSSQTAGQPFSGNQASQPFGNQAGQQPQPAPQQPNPFSGLRQAATPVSGLGPQPRNPQNTPQGGNPSLPVVHGTHRPEEQPQPPRNPMAPPPKHKRRSRSDVWLITAIIAAIIVIGLMVWGFMKTDTIVNLRGFGNDGDTHIEAPAAESAAPASTPDPASGSTQNQ